MISSVRLKNFKRFRDQTFDLRDHIVLAGPNNSGKSTLLQAVAVWNLALERWRSSRLEGSRRRERGIPITRKDFTAVPLREMPMLWTDSATALRKAEGQPGYPRLMEVSLTGENGSEAWELAFEFRCQSDEQIYVKPASPHAVDLPHQAEKMGIVHVPPFSGIGVQETRYDRPYQDLLVGQGKPGDILRNLLLEVYSNHPNDWDSLVGEVEEIFGYHLKPPEYEGRPFIVCEYEPQSSGEARRRTLDVSCAGSGFHQVLLLLAFFYARPSTVLLLDEPDAHLHVVLQKQVYDMLRRIASARQCQLIIATHAEVLIDATSPASILSLYGPPHTLLADTERDQIREALHRLPATDLLLAERARAVLYVEGDTDFDLLKAFARALDHPTYPWFAERPFWHSNRGRRPHEARGHFFALRALQRAMKGVLLLDGDNRGLPGHEFAADDLLILRWRRYEIESYLLNPEALIRFARSRSMPLLAERAAAYLRDQLPPAFFREPLIDHDILLGAPVSRTLLPEFFRTAQIDITKQDYYLIAEQMEPEEISPEVREKLDRIGEVFELSLVEDQ